MDVLVVTGRTVDLPTGQGWCKPAAMIFPYDPLKPKMFVRADSQLTVGVVADEAHRSGECVLVFCRRSRVSHRQLQRHSIPEEIRLVIELLIQGWLSMMYCAFFTGMGAMAGAFRMNDDGLIRDVDCSNGNLHFVFPDDAH